MDLDKMRSESNLFSLSDIVGVVIDQNIPVVYNLGTTYFILVSIHQSYYVMDVTSFKSVFKSNIFPTCLSSISCYRETVYIALETPPTIKIYHRHSELVSLTGHRYKIKGLLPLGSCLISWSELEVLIWNSVDNILHGRLLELEASNNDTISCILHPESYHNKIIIGFQNGDISLWNIKTLSFIYSFRSIINLNTENRSVTCFCQTIHPDIVGVGLKNGHVHLLDIKLDNILQTFSYNEDNVSVSCLSFSRNQLNHLPNDLLLVGYSNGSVGIWDTTEGQLLNVMEDTHSNEYGVNSINWIPNQSLFVTSGKDNSIKLWVMDNTNALPRQLKCRSGLPVSIDRLALYDDEGKNLICYGSSKQKGYMMRLGVYHQQQNCLFSQKKIKMISKNWKRPLINLPPITDMALNYSRHYDWANILTCHQHSSLTYTWSGYRLALEPQVLDRISNITSPNMTKSIKDETVVASCVAVTHCGNYAVVGYSDGSLHRFNVQSGAHRGHYSQPNNVNAHKGKVVSVLITEVYHVISASDSSNDCTIREWDLQKHELIHEMSLNPNEYNCIREVKFLGNLTAIHTVCQSKTGQGEKIILVDLASKWIVREFPVVLNDVITCMNFSPDARWFAFSTDKESYFYVYNIVSNNLIEWLKFQKTITYFIFDHSGSFVYLTQKNLPGAIIVLNNSSLFGEATVNFSLHSIPTEPVYMGFKSIPDTMLKDNNNECIRLSNQHCLEKIVENNLLELSSESKGRISAILHLEAVQLKNKSSAKPSDTIPFFLPSITSNMNMAESFEYPIEGSQNIKLNQKISDNSTISTKEKSSSCVQPIELQSYLTKLRQSSDFNHIVQAISIYLKSLSPSKIHLELYNIGEFGNGSNEEYIAMLDYLIAAVEKKKDCDFIQGIIKVFLNIHQTTLKDIISKNNSSYTTLTSESNLGDSQLNLTDSHSKLTDMNLLSKPEVHDAAIIQTKISKLKYLIQKDWECIRNQFDQNICFLKFLTHLQL